MELYFRELRIGRVHDCRAYDFPLLRQIPPRLLAANDTGNSTEASCPFLCL